MCHDPQETILESRGMEIEAADDRDYSADIAISNGAGLTVRGVDMFGRPERKVGWHWR